MIVQNYFRQQAASGNQGASFQQTDYEAHIKKFMEEIPWSIPLHDESSKDNKWLTSAQELRAHEAMRVAAGEKLEDEEELLAIRSPMKRGREEQDANTEAREQEEEEQEE